jgi:hypothetical protein
MNPWNSSVTDLPVDLVSKHMGEMHLAQPDDDEHHHHHHSNHDAASGDGLLEGDAKASQAVAASRRQPPSSAPDGGGTPRSVRGAEGQGAQGPRIWFKPPAAAR